MKDVKRRRLEEAREGLPIAQKRSELISSVQKYKTTVVVGETGSGKSTQLPQYLASAFPGKCIVCTQPRRVAATTLATRVSQEMSCTLGTKVGYTIRFDDVSSSETLIKYVTDGILLRECMMDQGLSRYKVIILDEAHERSINTDILMGLLKLLQAKRTDIRLVVMSATLDVGLFTSFFEDCNTVTVPGRQYHVQVLYTREPQEDYLDSALRTCVQIHCEAENSNAANEDGAVVQASPGQKDGALGDVLVFLPGQDDIESLVALLHEHLEALQSTTDASEGASVDHHKHSQGQKHRRRESNMKDFIITPLYAALPPALQAAAFAPTPPGSRKFILSTNIAETSVTISGIKYVVDTGYFKCRSLDSVTGVERLATAPISRAQANQRAGRAGREQDGVCYRVYTESGFESLAVTTVPEIQRVNVSQVLLQLLFTGVADPHCFPYPSPPDRESIKIGLKQLFLLGAISGSAQSSAGSSGNGGHQVQAPAAHPTPKYGLTPHGRRIAALPIDPTFAHLLLLSAERGCCSEVLTVVSMLSADTIFLSPPSAAERALAVTAHSQFRCPEGDMMSMVLVYTAWMKAHREPLWSRRYYLSQAGLTTAANIRQQLSELLVQVIQQNLPSSSSSSSQSSAAAAAAAAAAAVNSTCLPDRVPLLKCLAAGLFLNSARKANIDQYEGGSRAMSGGSLIGFGVPQGHTAGPGLGLGLHQNQGQGKSKYQSWTAADAATSLRPQYTTMLGGLPVFLHPSSSLFGTASKKLPEFVVYAELLTTTRQFVRVVSVAEAEWVEQGQGQGQGPRVAFFKRAVTLPGTGNVAVAESHSSVPVAFSSAASAGSSPSVSPKPSLVVSVSSPTSRSGTGGGYRPAGKGALLAGARR